MRVWVGVGLLVGTVGTVAAGDMVAVAVGVKLTQRPVVPLHEAFTSSTSPSRQWPPTGAPHKF
jgi:hypothetical protein